MKICSIGGCDKKVKAQGYCPAHYQRSLRGQRMDTPLRPHNATPEQRLWSKVNKSTDGGCWEWTGHLMPNGYGQLRRDGRVELAHRAAWEIENEVNLSPAQVIDHLCHNRKCVNPGHLRVTDQCANAQNLTGERTNNTSGHRNVSWHKGRSKWLVRVRAFGITHFGGYFVNKAEAIEAAEKLRNQVLPPIPEMKP